MCRQKCTSAPTSTGRVNAQNEPFETEPIKSSPHLRSVRGGGAGPGESGFDLNRNWEALNLEGPGKTWEVGGLSGSGGGCWGVGGVEAALLKNQFLAREPDQP